MAPKLTKSGVRETSERPRRAQVEGRSGFGSRCSKALTPKVDFYEMLVKHNANTWFGEPLGQKSRARPVQSGLERPGQSGQDRQVCSADRVSNAGLGNHAEIMRKSAEPNPDLDRIKGQSLSIYQDI